MSTWAPFCLYQTVFAPDNSACLGVVLQCNDRTDENVAACFDLLDGVAVLTRGLLQWMHQFAEGNWEAFTAAGAGCTSVEACYVWPIVTPCSVSYSGNMSEWPDRLILGNTWLHN